MKKIFAILMALVVLGFTQCKPEPVESDGGKTRTVTVTCEIPINNGNRSDFSGLHNGTINWSNGTERVYLAIPGANHQIIELTCTEIENTPSSLVFSGTVSSALIENGAQYEVWYFGNSMNLNEDDNQETSSYVTKTIDGEKITKIDGRIAKQSGRLNDLGYCHIAKAEVTALTDGKKVTLYSAQLENQMAIAVMDLNNVTSLYGDAIIGTEYSLVYNDDRGYALNIVEDPTASIEVTPAEGLSYVVLLPNEKVNTEIRTRIDDNAAESYKIYEYIFEPQIEASCFYHVREGEDIKPLPWNELVSGEIDHGGHVHEYVDLGLPSGLLWATMNIGAETMYDYGNYYAWGEIGTKDSYTEDSYSYCEYVYSQWDDDYHYIYEPLGDISGEANYDVAAATWGEGWRMPTITEFEELFANCTMYPIKTENNVNGYMFVSKTNGNHIFFPAAGYKDGKDYGDGVPDFYNKGTHGYYWSSTPTNYNSGAQGFYFDKGYYSGQQHAEEIIHYYTERWYGFSVRAVRDVTQSNK